MDEKADEGDFPHVHMQDPIQDIDNAFADSSTADDAGATIDLDDVSAIDALSDDEKRQLCSDAMALKEHGNREFKDGAYEDSIVTYSKALEMIASHYRRERAILYSNRAIAKLRFEQKTAAVEDATKSINLNATYVKPWLWRAQAREALEKYEEAREDYETVQRLDSSIAQAGAALNRLPQLTADRDERIKTEMWAKLKTLGNAVLKPFGMSTDSIKFDQDPSSGGYNIRFENNSPANPSQ